MTEYCFTLSWLGDDQDLNIPRWLHDGLARILQQDKELRSIERRRRRDAGLPEPTAAEEPVGLLLPAMRERMIAARDALRDELAAIDHLEDRLEPPRALDTRAPEVRARDLPSFRAQARATGMGDVYALSYTFDSLAIAHPNSMAAEQLLDLATDRSGGVVAATPTRSLPDPYAVGAALFILLLERGGEQVPELAAEGLADVLERLRRLEPFKPTGRV